MDEESSADKIWNRACYGGGENPRAGDKALAALLRFHGLAMNGGVLHAAACLSEGKLREAQDGYRFFGFGPIADLIDFARDAVDADVDLDALEPTTNERYWAQISDDGVLFTSFENHRERHLSEYSPITGNE